MATSTTTLTLEELKNMYRDELHPLIEQVFNCGAYSERKKSAGVVADCPISKGSHEFVQVPFVHHYECRHCGAARDKDY